MRSLCLAARSGTIRMAKVYIGGNGKIIVNVLHVRWFHSKKTASKLSFVSCYREPSEQVFLFLGLLNHKLLECQRQCNTIDEKTKAWQA